MRILYAAGNREGSYSQLKRYLPQFKKSFHEFQFAGYRKYLKDIKAEYCLDALINFTGKLEGFSFTNGNLSYYANQIAQFKPDLIISDFDYFTSIIGIEKGIPVWQVSPALLHYSLPQDLKLLISAHKYNTNIYGDEITYWHIKHALSNSDRRLVLSHLSDSPKRPELLYGYEWCRPEFEPSKDNLPSDGTETSLADKFYAQKFAITKVLFNDAETSACSYCNNYYGLGKFDIRDKEEEKIEIKIDRDTKFLMELLQ